MLPQVHGADDSMHVARVLQKEQTVDAVHTASDHDRELHEQSADEPGGKQRPFVLAHDTQFTPKVLAVQKSEEAPKHGKNVVGFWSEMVKVSSRAIRPVVQLAIATVPDRLQFCSCRSVRAFMPLDHWAS
jgi:hypothetical protein